MKKYINIFLVLALVSCSKNHGDKAYNCKVLNIKPLKNSSLVVEDFSNYVDSVVFIPLETKEESFIVDISKILLTANNDMIVLNNTNLLMFDRFGKFKFKIGKNGKGPGEYIKINDICISEDNEKLMALSCFNSVLMYSLTDGKFISEIKIDWPKKESSFDGICTSNDNGFYIFSSNPNKIDDFQSDFFCLGKFDSTGKLINESFKRRDFCFSINRFSNSCNNITFMRPQEGDNRLYKIENGKISPVFSLDFENEYIPQKHIFSFSNNAWSNIPVFIKSPYYKLPMGFLENSTYIYFYIAGPQAENHEFLLKKNSYKGIHWKSFDLTPFNFIASDSTYFYTSFSDLCDNEKFSPLKKYILNKYGLKYLKDEENPIIVKIRFKP